MTALLELPGFRERVQPMSVETYHRLGEMGLLSEKVELLRGILVTKMSKSPLHELVCQKLMKLLLARVPAGYEVRREGPLTLEDSEPEPDFSIVQGRADDWAHAHPTTAALVVEVAVCNPDVDEGKAELYAEAGVPEYWIVKPEERTVEVYREPAKGGYRVRTRLAERDTVQSVKLPGLELVLAEVLRIAN